MRAPARNPATGAEGPGATPRIEHREGQRSPGPGANDERRAGPAGGGDGAAHGSVGLRELREHRPASRDGSVHSGREAMTRAGAAQRDEYRPGDRKSVVEGKSGELVGL